MTFEESLSTVLTDQWIVQQRLEVESFNVLCLSVRENKIKLNSWTQRDQT